MNHKKIYFWLMLLCLALFLTACGSGQITKESPKAVDSGIFSCYTLDQRGEWLYGYEREADGKWYLFLPSTQQIDDLVLYYTGPVTGVSGGEWDQETRTVAHAFASSGEELLLTIEGGATVSVVVLQSDLPSVQIQLKETTLEEIHKDKSVKYYRNSFILTDPDGEHDMAVINSVELKGRGNSSWELYEKKGYQIEFSTPLSVMGMGKACKWVLLANASDDSMIRNQLVSHMAQRLDMGFVPSFEYVDLWIDGAYQGTYLMGEKVELGNSRLALSQPDGALFEHDVAFYAEEDYWFFDELLHKYFVLKETVADEAYIIDPAVANFRASVEELAAFLYTTASSNVTLDALNTVIDVDSFAKYYLINEYVQNREAFATSFYWYQDGAGDVVHLGPIWDFDTCMGNDGTDYMQTYGENHVLYKYLLASPQFHARTVELYEQYIPVFSAMAEQADVLREQIRDSAQMNYLRWNTLGSATGKAEGQFFHESFDAAVDAVKTWLDGREDYFQVVDCEAINSEVIYSAISEDYRLMYMYLKDAAEYDSVTFAVWNENSKDGMVLWYPSALLDGVWCGALDLSFFNTPGIYNIHAYVNGQNEAYATGRNYVKKTAEPYNPLYTEVSEDGTTVKILLEDELRPCTAVSFDVWSQDNAAARSDIQHFYAARNKDGLWEYTVDMSIFQTSGQFYIHAFENADGTQMILNATTFRVEAS